MKTKTGHAASVRILEAAVILAWILSAMAVANEGTALTVVESGVGTAVANRELQGKADSFPEGSTVCFFTKTTGPQAGDTIDHVWIRDGQETHKKTLAIGGSPWRTWSCKTLHKGSVGPWTVEARTAGGKVIGKAGFTCTAAP